MIYITDKIGRTLWALIKQWNLSKNLKSLGCVKSTLSRMNTFVTAALSRIAAVASSKEVKATLIILFKLKKPTTPLLKKRNETTSVSQRRKKWSSSNSSQSSRKWTQLKKTQWKYRPKSQRCLRQHSTKCIKLCKRNQAFWKVTDTSLSASIKKFCTCRSFWRNKVKRLHLWSSCSWTLATNKLKTPFNAIGPKCQATFKMTRIWWN